MDATTEPEPGSVSARGFSIPLQVPFRGMDRRTGAVVRGPVGWGEFSPFPGHSDGKEALCRQAAFASATQPWPAPVRQKVQVHATIPEVSPEQAERMVLHSACSSAKVKVGDAGEEARLEAVRGALGPEGRLSIDVNGMWDLDEAVQKISRLARFGLEYVEQPVASIEDMRALRRCVDVPLAADEMIKTSADAKLVAETGAADVMIVKVQHFGGVNMALQAVEDSGLPAVVSSLIETSVGIAAGLALAAALPELPFSCGLGTVGLLDGDLAAKPLVPVDGFIEIRRPVPEEALLSRFESQLPGGFLLAAKLPQGQAS